jgi:hypothetical protein
MYIKVQNKSKQLLKIKHPNLEPFLANLVSKFQKGLINLVFTKFDYWCKKRSEFYADFKPRKNCLLTRKANSVKLLKSLYSIALSLPHHHPFRARICKLFKEPRNRFPSWRPGTTTLFDGPARLAT